MFRFFLVTGIGLAIINGWISWWLWRVLSGTGWLRFLFCGLVLVLGAAFPLLYKGHGDTLAHMWLLRAGALAEPVEIIGESSIGRGQGADNIARGINSVVWGMVAIAVFMCIYYALFGIFSTVSLAVNVLLLLAILSMLQATLTLPGIAAMALALGVAIDSNVLINERIREELRAGVSPQAAIHAGYERAWATILDSNVTTLIAGLALLAFGSGPVRGFAVVHCIGILTSMFSAVFFSRGLVNLWYGGKKKLKSVAIGQVWKPESDSAVAKTN